MIKTRQDKTRQGKERQVKSQDKTKQDKTRLYQTRQRQGRTRQDTTRQDMTRHARRKTGRTRQGKTQCTMQDRDVVTVSFFFNRSIFILIHFYTNSCSIWYLLFRTIIQILRMEPKSLVRRRKNLPFILLFLLRLFHFLRARFK